MNNIFKFLKFLLETDWVKLTITGAVGAFIIYIFVMMPIEKRKEKRAIQREHDKDERDKKEKCTKALLATQMALLLQIAKIKGIENLVNFFLNYKLGGKLITEFFKGTENMSEQTDLLFQLYQNKKLNPQILVPFMKHIILDNASMIALPDEIFAMSLPPSKINVDDATEYLQELASLNVNYENIHSLLTHHNKTKKTVSDPIILKSNFNENGISESEIRQCLSVIPAVTDLASQLKKLIIKYLETANKIFSATDTYIKLLDISQPIRVNRDEEDNIIFDPH